MNIDEILTEIHKQCGICGHCGKKQCAGKSSHSTLPRVLDTETVLAILNEAALLVRP